MKRFYALMLCICLLALPVVALVGDTGFYVNNPNPEDQLHLRTNPSDGAISLGKYYNGTQLILLEDLGDWFWVRVGGENGGLEGYMKRSYISAGDVASAMPEFMSGSSAWELYDQPSENANYCMCGYGTEFVLMGFTPGWWHISTRDGRMTGFVRADQNAMSSSFPAVVNSPNPADRLHLRTEPSTDAVSLGKYYNGVMVMVLGFYGDNQWARVRVGTLEGYMNASCLAIGDAMGSVASALPTVTAMAPEGQYLLLRQEPTNKAAALESYPNGTRALVYGVAEHWVHVQVNGVEGFMVAEYLALPQ